MKTVQEIEEQLREERDHVSQLYAQVSVCEKHMEQLKSEIEIAKNEDEQSFIDEWLRNHFGIASQAAARKKSLFIVFDKKADFIKTVATGYGEKFQYVSPAENEDTLEHWLRDNRLYAHRAASFCGRDRSWYDLSLKEQLESLEWCFDENGMLESTQW